MPIPKQKLKLLIGILAVVIIVIIALVYFFGGSKEDTTAKREISIPNVDAVILHKQVLDNVANVYGNLIPFEEIEVKNEVAGRIVTLNLPEGTAVSKGTLLVKLYDGDLQAQKRKIEAELKVQEDILSRREKLLKVDGISKNDYESTLLAVNQLKAEIEVANANIEKTEIRAPFNGVIGLRRVSNGAVIASGTTLATLRSSGSLKLDFTVPERYASQVRIGSNVAFFLNGDRTKMYHARISATEHGIDNASKDLQVRSIVQSYSSELIAGAYASVILNLGENPEALLVPSKAVIPDESKKSLLVARNGFAHLVEITTGVREADNVEITGGDIHEGDTVITNGLMFLKEGSPIKYSKITGQ